HVSMAPLALPGETWQAFTSTLPAETTTAMPAERSCVTALSSAGMSEAVSAMNDQLATAGPPRSAWSSTTHFAPSTIPLIVPRRVPHWTIFTSTISASGATPKVAPAIAPATAVPCALQIFGSDGNAVYPIRTLPASSGRSEEHTSELQSLRHLVCRLLLEKKNPNASFYHI